MAIGRLELQMPSSCVLTFSDPYSYQTAIRAAQVEIVVTAKGDFRSELTKIELPRLWMQRGRESLPRISNVHLPLQRTPFFFLAAANQPPIHHTGMKLSPGEILADGLNTSHHDWTSAPCHWASMSLPPDDFGSAVRALTGRDLTVPSVTRLVRPSPASFSRLSNLHEAAGRLAKTEPGILARPEVAGALERSLVHAMIQCLADGIPVELSIRGRNFSRVIARFKEQLAAKYDKPLYLADICAATEVSERTLRVACKEQLGMGPIRYLGLRRMTLARRALLLAYPTESTVTEIATKYGFWELGRFSVEYRSLFGETPKATLHRPSDDRDISQVYSIGAFRI
jgi:AraC-like DNA-binding protein